MVVVVIIMVIVIVVMVVVVLLVVVVVLRGARSIRSGAAGGGGRKNPRSSSTEISQVRQRGRQFLVVFWPVLSADRGGGRATIGGDVYAQYTVYAQHYSCVYA